MMMREWGDGWVKVMKTLGDSTVQRIIIIIIKKQGL